MRPKLGIYYKEAHQRLSRISKIENPNVEYKQRLTQSLLYQTSLAEGEGAKSELMKEFTEKPSSLSGAGCKQTGFCIKYDCINRETRCNRCIKYSDYEVQHA